MSSNNKDTVEILEIAERRKNIFHGIRKKGSMEKIREEGIKPYSANNSCWTTGLGLFISSYNHNNPEQLLFTGSMQTYDTSFFHYAHVGAHKDKCLMQIAISDAETLSEYGIPLGWKNNGQVFIKQEVPKDALSLIELTVKHPEIDVSDVASMRKYGKAIERKMITVLLSALRNYKTDTSTTKVFEYD